MSKANRIITRSIINISYEMRPWRMNSCFSASSKQNGVYNGLSKQDKDEKQLKQRPVKTPATAQVLLERWFYSLLAVRMLHVAACW